MSKIWDPIRQIYCEDRGEVTPRKEGVSFGPGPGHKVAPRVVGTGNVAAFRALWGLCKGLDDTCRNVSGHAGPCRGDL